MVQGGGQSGRVSKGPNSKRATSKAKGNGNSSFNVYTDAGVKIRGYKADGSSKQAKKRKPKKKNVIDELPFD